MRTLKTLGLAILLACGMEGARLAYIVYQQHAVMWQFVAPIMQQELAKQAATKAQTSPTPAPASTPKK